MNKYVFNKKKNAPDNLSTEAIDQFKSDFTFISDKMKEGNNLVYIDNTSLKEQITVVDEDMIRSYLNDHKDNSNFHTVIQKVRIIDFINSTNLRMNGVSAFADIANVILEIPDFDKRVKEGAHCLVTELAKGIKKATGNNLFSFATKYCCYHNFYVYQRDDYSIYDTALMKAIPKYMTITQQFIYDEIRGKMDYEQYHSLISAMIKEYQITTKNPRRDTDFYLWYLYR